MFFSMFLISIFVIILRYLYYYSLSIYLRMNSNISGKGMNQPNNTNKQFSSLNIYMLGPMCSGKTCIVHQLLNKKFLKDTLPTTNEYNQYNMQITRKSLVSIESPQNTQNMQTCIGHPNKAKEEENKAIDVVKFNIWDLGGNEVHDRARIGTIKHKSWNKVGLIVYDISDEKSFNKVEKFINQWKTYVQKQNTQCLILIGNKTDLQKQSKRKVQYSVGLQLAKKHNIIFIQCTAKFDIKYIFESAYYLKLSSAKKYLNKIDIVENYIEHIESKLSNYQMSRELKLQDCSKVLQAWQDKAMPLIFCLQQFFSTVDKEIDIFLKNHLGRYEIFLNQFQNLRYEGDQLNNLESIKLMISSKVSPSKIEEEQISNLMKIQNKKQQQQTEMIENLIAQAKSKIDHMHENIIKNIEKQKSYMNLQLLEFTQKFNKIRNKYSQSLITQFVDNLNSNLEKSSKIMQYYNNYNIRDSIEVISNTSMHAQDLLSKLQQEQKQKSKQMQKLRKIIYEHFQILEKFKNSINSMEDNLIQFYTTLKSQYASLDISFSFRSLNVDKNEVLEFLLNDFVNKFIRANYSDFKEDQEIVAYHTKDSKKQRQIKKRKIVTSKTKSIKKQYEQKLSAHYDELKGLGGKLKKEIVFAHNERNKIHLLKHQISIINSLVSEAKRKMEKDNQKQEKGGFKNLFSKIFNKE